MLQTYLILYCNPFSIMHAAADFSLHTLTVSAVSVDGSTPGAKVTWSTTAPPGCVASVRVDFRTSNQSKGSVVRSYTTTNTSETEVIQTGLQCNTTYYIRVEVTVVASLSTVENNQVQVLALVGGKVKVI